MSALTKCKACTKEISKNAKACPHCGEAIRRTHPVTVIIGLLATFWMIGYFTSPDSGQTDSPKLPDYAVNTGKSTGLKTNLYEAAPSNWVIQRSKSEMTDTPTVMAIVQSSNEYSYWLGGPKKAEFVARCSENKTEALLSTNSRFNVEYGEYNKARIRLRIDDKKPVTQYWSESTDGEAAFATGAIKLLKDLRDAKTLTVEFIPFNSSPAILKFDVSGFAPHLDEIAKTCNWKM